MHNHDDKYPARPGFEPGTSRLLQAPVDTKEPSGPAIRAKYDHIHIISGNVMQYEYFYSPFKPFLYVGI